MIISIEKATGKKSVGGTYASMDSNDEHKAELKALDGSIADNDFELIWFPDSTGKDDPRDGLKNDAERQAIVDQYIEAVTEATKVFLIPEYPHKPPITRKQWTDSWSVDLAALRNHDFSTGWPSLVLFPDGKYHV
jgi:hypothetical protein